MEHIPGKRNATAAASDEEYLAIATYIRDGFPNSRHELPLKIRQFWPLADQLHCLDEVPIKGDKILIMLEVTNREITSKSIQNYCTFVIIVWTARGRDREKIQDGRPTHEFYMQDDEWKWRLPLRKLGTKEHVLYTNFILPTKTWDFTFTETVAQ